MALPFRQQQLLRFSLATLLFATFCIAGFFAGYRTGFDVGQQGGSEARLIVKSYPVADLIVASGPLGGFAQPDFDSLVDLTQTTVAPETWASNGMGSGKIRVYPSNLSLMISQTADVHADVALLFQQLRELQSKVAVNGHP
jgi:hypothetical protein